VLRRQSRQAANHHKKQLNRVPNSTEIDTRSNASRIFRCNGVMALGPAGGDTTPGTPLSFANSGTAARVCRRQTGPWASDLDFRLHVLVVR
jgi:hypothetical protein